MAAFAKKSTEKVTAVAHRAEAVAYANEQKQRAEQLEDLLQIAHDTSNRSEAERARTEAALAQIRLLIAAHRPRLKLADPILLGKLDRVLEQPAELEAAAGERA
jgi:hypothetical protein